MKAGAVLEGIPFETAESGRSAIDSVGIADRFLEPLLKHGKERFAYASLLSSDGTKTSGHSWIQHSVERAIIGRAVAVSVNPIPGNREIHFRRILKRSVPDRCAKQCEARGSDAERGAPSLMRSHKCDRCLIGMLAKLSDWQDAPSVCV